MSRYLKRTTLALAADFLSLEARLAAKVSAVRTGLAGSVLRTVGLQEAYLGLRARLMAARMLLRHVKLGAVLKGSGPLKALHAAMIPLELVFSRRAGKSQRVLARHTNIHGALQLIILPFEDNSTLETDRMERCPCAFAFYDPKQDEVGRVPVCAWGLHKKKVMEEIAGHYRAARAKGPAV